MVFERRFGWRRRTPSPKLDCLAERCSIEENPLAFTAPIATVVIIEYGNVQCDQAERTIQPFLVLAKHPHAVRGDTRKEVRSAILAVIVIPLSDQLHRRAALVAVHNSTPSLRDKNRESEVRKGKRHNLGLRTFIELGFNTISPREIDGCALGGPFLILQ
jgi:hypothetical protein